MTQEQAMIEYFERKFSIIMNRLDRLELLQRGVNPDLYAFDQAMNKNKQEQGWPGQ